MNYTPKEEKILNLMHRSDFKNLSKNDVISFASKLNELRPEVAKEVLAKYPEFIDLMKSTLLEYRGILDSIIKSDDKSIQEYYSITTKEIDNAGQSRIYFYDFVKLVQEDYSRCLDTPNLPPDKMMEILNRQMELVKIANEKDTEIRNLEKEIERNVNKKDAEKRNFNWKLIGGISIALITVISVSAGVLGGNITIKLPKPKL